MCQQVSVPEGGKTVYYTKSICLLPVGCAAISLAAGVAGDGAAQADKADSMLATIPLADDKVLFTFDWTRKRKGDIG